MASFNLWVIHNQPHSIIGKIKSPCKIARKGRGKSHPNSGPNPLLIAIIENKAMNPELKAKIGDTTTMNSNVSIADWP